MPQHRVSLILPSTLSRCSSFSSSLEISPNRFHLDQLASSSPSWSPVSPEVNERCSSLADLTGKACNVNFRAEYRPVGSAFQPSNIFSCIEVCDRPSCLDGCQKDHGELDCMPTYSDSNFCYGPDVCERATCDGSSLLDAPPVCLDDGCPFTFLDRDESLEGQQLSTNMESTLPTGESMEPSLPCRWELPDDQCDVSLPSANALGQHIFQDHIEPLATFIPWEPTNILPPEQQPAEYLCQWGTCTRSFSDHAALERHVKVAHTNLDCRWAGCEVSKESPALLKTHVNMDHLNINQDMTWQLYPHGYKTSSEQHAYSGVDRISTDAQGSNFGLDGRFQASASQDTMANPSFSRTGTYENPSQGTYPSSNTVQSPPVNSNNQITWPIAPVVRPAPSSHSLSSSFSNLQGSSQAQFQLPAQGSLKISSVDNNPLHTCHWLVDQSLSQTCGATFTDANILQTHVNEDHIAQIGMQSILCHWQGCKRNKGPKPMFPNKEKLRRHMYTHTGCEYPCHFVRTSLKLRNLTALKYCFWRNPKMCTQY